MSKLCSTCGQVIDDNATTCPFCGGNVASEPKEESKIEDVLEVPGMGEIETLNTEEQSVPVEIIETPIVEETSVQEEALGPLTVADVPAIEVGETTTVEEKPTITSEVSTVEPVKEEVVTQTVEETPQLKEETKVEKDDLTPTLSVSASSIVNFNQEESTEKSVANETSDTTITNDNVLQEVSVSDLENIEIDSSNLETVSVEATDSTLNEVEEVLEMPAMPEPTIGEINSDVLGNIYDEEERKNNDKIAEKNRRDEEERMRKEEEAKNAVPMEKPDLLASTTNNDEIEGSGVVSKKKKMDYKKILNIATVLIILVIALVAVWYFFLRDEEPEINDDYMTPIITWFKGYNDGNTTTMLSAYVPCLRQADDIMEEVNNRINERNGYQSFYLEYKEETAEVVNSLDREPLNEYLAERCPTDTPSIDDYKRVYINQKISDNAEEEPSENNPIFYTIKIENNWYVLAFQEQ